MARFWVVAGAFHLAVGAVAVWLGRRWPARVRRRAPGWLWGLRLAADGMVFGLTALFAGLVAALVAPYPAFSLLRFLCQALFGEAVLLALWIALLHARARQRVRAALPAAVALLLLAGYAEAYHHGPRALRVVHHTADLAPGSVPRGALRLLHLTDLQTHSIGAHERRALATARELKPEIIAFTGDYVQSRMGSDRAPAVADLRRVLREMELRPRYGFYAVGGDVEPADWREELSDLGIACLQDDTVTIRLSGGVVLTVTGLSLATSRAERPAEVEALFARAAGDVRLALGHSPDYVRGVAGLAPAIRPHLALAGHTHGGQVVLPGYGALVTLSRLPRRYAAGLQLFEGLPLHVGRGIGMERLTAPQVRFLCPPEVCLLTLRY